VEKEKPFKGLNFVDQNLSVALNNIYNGRYDLAISNCEDVLMLEPDNMLALNEWVRRYTLLEINLKRASCGIMY